MKNMNGKKLRYLPRLLAEIHRETGLIFVAACCGGAALFSVSHGAAYCAQLLAEVPSGVKYLIPVLCGKDFYNGSWNDAVGLAAADFCEAARARCEHVFAIVDTPAKTLQYSGPRALAYGVAC